MVEFLLDPAFWSVLAILVGLELVLGVDNVVFVSLITARVPEEQRNRARRIGLAISALVQIALLALMLWIAGIDRVAFTVAGWSPSWSQLAFLAGGLFLVFKAVSELHAHIEHGSLLTAIGQQQDGQLSFAAVIVRVAAINAVFSVDTIITAIGVTRSVEPIVAAILLTTAIIFFAAGRVSRFIAGHRSIRGLALAFLLIIGGTLVCEGLGFAPDRIIIYAAIGLGTFILAVIKLYERWGRGENSDVEVPAAREEPVLDTPTATPDPVASSEPVIEPKSVRDEDELEVPVPDVQKSEPKRRAPRRKAPRKPKASPQG